MSLFSLPTKLWKNEGRAKKKLVFIAMPSVNNFGKASVMEKRGQSQEKTL